MKNAKNNNANLYSNFSPRFFKSYFLTGGALVPPGPPLESPMSPTESQGTCQGEEGSPQSVTVEIEGVPVTGIIDTGSNISIL